jgi:hypothetical protein
MRQQRPAEPDRRRVLFGPAFNAIRDTTYLLRAPERGLRAPNDKINMKKQINVVGFLRDFGSGDAWRRCPSDTEVTNRG